MSDCSPYVRLFSPTAEMKQMVIQLIVVNTPLNTIIKIIQQQFDYESDGTITEKLTQDTFTHHFSFELESAKYLSRAQIASTLFYKAMTKKDDNTLLGWLRYFGNDQEDQLDNETNKHIIFMDAEISSDDWIKKEYDRTKRRPEL